MSTQPAAKAGGPLSGGLGLFVFVVLILAAGYLSYRTLTEADPAAPRPLERDFVCSDTGRHFVYTLQMGDTWPVLSPFSKKHTGYPAERCYWTRDGKRKSAPTYVILNEMVKKPGDTICPDCGRLVVGHNPEPPANVPLAESGAGQQSP
jgi:hypothetical protein